MAGKVKHIFLPGQIVDGITVLALAPNERCGNRYLCKCVCGKEFHQLGYYLASQKPYRCGCRMKEARRENGRKNRLPEGQNSVRNGIIRHYRSPNSTSKRKIECTLTDEQFEHLFQGKCHYCGRPPFKKAQHGNKPYATSYVHNGIDRVDNSLGYTPENSVSCCFQCNIAKGTMTVEEFRDWRILIASNLNLTPDQLATERAIILQKPVPIRRTRHKYYYS